MKKPIIAAILNIITGLGYIYVGGKRMLFGLLLLLGFAAGTAWSFDPELATYLENPSTWQIWLYWGTVLTVGAFMYDGYLYAVESNANSKKRKK